MGRTHCRSLDRPTRATDDFALDRAGESQHYPDGRNRRAIHCGRPQRCERIGQLSVHKQHLQSHSHVSHRRHLSAGRWDPLPRPTGDLLQRTHARSSRNAIDAAIAYNAATSGVSLSTVFPNTNFGRQAEQVARAIAAREQLGHQRQIFFISRGGFDHHSGLVNFNGSTPAGDSQYAYLGEVDGAIASLYAALEEIETSPGDLTDNVVIFSASDFSRTLNSNGNGSDHAWGANQFIISGSGQHQPDGLGQLPD